jgi:hypothetical protein
LYRGNIEIGISVFEGSRMSRIAVTQGGNPGLIAKNIHSWHYFLQGFVDSFSLSFSVTFVLEHHPAEARGQCNRYICQLFLVFGLVAVLLLPATTYQTDH